MEFEINLTEVEYVYINEKTEWANDEVFPSQEFSFNTDIDNLYTDWIIHPSIEEDKMMYWKLFFLEDIRNDDEHLFFLREGRRTLSIKMYNQLIIDNPKLADINTATSAEKMDVVHGAISKFIYSDIKHFVESRDSIIEYNEKFFPICTLIEEKTSALVEWVMSPETLERVLNTLNIPIPTEKI